MRNIPEVNLNFLNVLKIINHKIPDLFKSPISGKIGSGISLDSSSVEAS